MARPTLTSRLSSADPSLDALVDVTSGDVLSYGELTARVDHLADALARAGVVEGTRVAGRLPRGSMRVIAPLACWSLGAAYLPTEPGWSAALHSLILERAGATLLIDDRGKVHRLATSNTTHGSESLRLILRTSGTTGAPRLIGLTEENLRWFIEAHPQALPLQPGQRMAQFAPHTFDFFFCELIASLCAGACMILLPEEVCGGFGIANLSEMLRRMEVEAVSMTPSVLELITPGPRLRLICSGGERLSSALVRRLSEGGREVINVYGPSETTIFALSHRCDPRKEQDPPLGSPLPGVILSTRLVEDGEELVIEGPCVAAGYLSAPSPGGFLGARRYATGDRVRRDGDGKWQFRGRIDWQCKIAGVRVEPDEVARVMERHEGIDAAVVFVEDEETTPWLRAVYLGAAAVDHEELRALLQDHLPRAAIPSQFMHRAHWPTNARGKLDRVALLQDEG